MPIYRKTPYTLLFAAVLATAGIGASFAEVKTKAILSDVLQHVAETHPSLEAERARLSSTQEGVRQAASNWFPSVTASGSASSALTEPGAFGSNSGETANVGLSVTQPLYRGGQTVSRVKEANHFVDAQKETLKSVEQTILLSAVTAYIALIRDYKVVSLRSQNVENLETHLESEEVRFELGENTVTDVSQSKARLAAAKAEQQKAKGQLINTEAAYMRVVGQKSPDISSISLPSLELLKMFENLSDLDRAIATSYEMHPDILLARITAQANKADQRAIKGELYPTLSVVGETGRTFRPVFASGEAYQDTSSVALQARVPLYLGGETRSRLKQSQLDGNRLRLEVLDVEREIRERVTTAWQNLHIAKAEVGSRETQVEAERLALDGTREEYDLGGRTTLDVLDAQQEKLDADVALVSAKHDVVLAEFQLLAATGQLTLKKILKVLP